MARFVHEVIDVAAKAKTRKEKIDILKQNETWALKDLLRGAYDQSIVWDLPPGAPPYEPCEARSAPTNLHKKHKSFIYFAKGGKGNNLLPVKREAMFISMLEAVPAREAELLVLMKDKQPLGKGLTKKLVEEAFPNLIRK